MNDSILVSIIIPTYKRADMLTRAIDSALAQTYPHIEILVIDDNDPETEWRAITAGIMAQYAEEPRVRYIRHKRNQNGSVARNTGMCMAKGQLITFLDDDDWYLETKVERQVEFLLTHPQVRAVFCGWNRDGEDVIPKLIGDMSLGLLSGRNILITNSLMLWREDALRCGGFDPEFRRHQEAVFMLRYFRQGGTIGRLPEVLVGFDVSDRSNEPTPEKDEAYNFQLLHAFADVIDRCEREHPGAKNLIYCQRFRVVLIKYIKHKCYGSALRLYLKLLRIAPVDFHLDLAEYIRWRLFQKGKA